MLNAVMSTACAFTFQYERADQVKVAAGPRVRVVFRPGFHAEAAVLRRCRVVLEPSAG
jgi:hypothetical protein